MLPKQEIFEDIVHILKYDYAGYKEKAALINQESITITDEMSDLDFLKAVQRYLYAFNDGHLSFNSSKVKLPFRGFQVRRFEDALYVTKVSGEERLQVGDKIIAINDEAIDAAAARYLIYLQSDVFERQLWNNVLPFAETITFIRNNDAATIPLSNYDRPAYVPEYSYKKLDENTAYIKLTDFAQGEPIQRMVTENEQALNEISTIIFDVRVNNGGNDMFYFPLVPYTIDQTVSSDDLGEPDEHMYTNYTARNCDLWIQSLSEYLTQPLDEETRLMLEQEIEKYKTNYNIGFQQVIDGTTFTFDPKGKVQQVYILTDITCASSGETFVKNLRLSPKVQIIGRGTMGILDYCNQTTKNYGDFELHYSISKLNEKYFKNDTGEIPDIHIPWTPQHLVEDVDLNYVLNLRQQQLQKR